MVKKTIILFIVFIAMSSSYVVFSQDKEKTDENIADWAKRINYNVQIETDAVPIFYFETVQPLCQNIDETNTYFIQPRVSIKAEDATYNLGTGCRRMIAENWLLGANIFGDYQDDHEHGRIGLGGEVLGKKVEARINGYWGITTARKVEEADGILTAYEQVCDGMDAELGTPVPYVPWLKVYGSGFWWNYKYANDKFGWKSRLEAKVNKWSVLEFYMWDDNKGEVEMGGKVEVKVPFDNWNDIKTAFKKSEVAYPDKDLREYNLIPVEREFNIIVEKWNETPTGKITVQVGRGS